MVMTITMALSRAINPSQNDANMIGVTDTSVLSNVEEDLIFSQLADRYNDDSMFNTSLLDNSSMECTTSYQTTINNDTIYTQSREENNILSNTQYTETKIIQNWQIYLEKEYFPETGWYNF